MAVPFPQASWAELPPQGPIHLWATHKAQSEQHRGGGETSERRKEQGGQRGRREGRVEKAGRKEKRRGRTGERRDPRFRPQQPLTIHSPQKALGKILS